MTQSSTEQHAAPSDVELRVAVSWASARRSAIFRRIRALFASGVSSGADVERYFGLPYLGALPIVRDAGRSPFAFADALLAREELGFSLALRRLHGALVHARDDRRVQVIAVTSALPGDGKTTSALSLARFIALKGHSIIVVDCDIRRGSLTKELRVLPDAGLLDFLEGRCELRQAVVRDDFTTACVLPQPLEVTTSKDVLGGQAMRALIAELRTRFQFVILDTPPVLAVADTQYLAGLADTTLILTRCHKTPRKAVYAAVRLLRSRRIHLAGLALTQARTAPPRAQSPA